MIDARSLKYHPVIDIVESHHVKIVLMNQALTLQNMRLSMRVKELEQQIARLTSDPSPG